MITPHLTIFTDGSSLGNPGPGGYGAVILDSDKKIELSGGEPHTTNNRMEMKAIIEALKWVKNNNKKNAPIILHSDSQLLIKTLTQNWKRKKNLDLWQELDMAKQGLNIDFQWIKAHAGKEHNERCDQLAKTQALKLNKTNSNPKKQMDLFSNPADKEGDYHCQNCDKKVFGILGLQPDSNLIRVDCRNCEKFIKFAPLTDENKKMAKNRILLSENELQKLLSDNPSITKKITQKLKSMTSREASGFLKKLL